ncbi:hypothetical protein POVWA2_046000 [Plasmodium ovale wallikeri]|uniref:Uncharacterized protein n=1 Tax=Plasmodium ovale wallikeri TaxID=864142 RepID=A0A1A8ZGV9_PLAOA|nr:hypothetical protein POVWA1_047120 [Plasmodium ovale wallikeri]SBT43503.1 hypothetical protein POVWA2_046000 [Plasmodium ovale wallikeri]
MFSLTKKRSTKKISTNMYKNENFGQRGEINWGVAKRDETCHKTSLHVVEISSHADNVRQKPQRCFHTV